MDAPPKAHDSTDVSEEGVPEEAVGPDQGVAEVEEAMDDLATKSRDLQFETIAADAEIDEGSF